MMSRTNNLALHLVPDLNVADRKRQLCLCCCCRSI
jgi:hypothetical protein